MWLLGVILDNICGFFKVCFSRTLSKQIYRNCAVLMTGTVVVAVLVFTAGSFTGGGKNQVYAVKASRNAEEAGEGRFDGNCCQRKQAGSVLAGSGWR